MTTVVHKQPEITALFQRLLANNQMQHAYIFEGVAGVGKYEMAKWVAQAIYCQNPTDKNTPCLSCNQCLRIEHEEHPDVVTVVPNGATIKVDQVREIKDNFSKSGMESRRKILIVQDMDKMTISAANSLLKFLEEPEGQITIILLTTEIQKLLPTIVSRCQIVHFPVRNIEDRVAEIISRNVPKETATLLSYLTQDTEQALAIYEDEEFQGLVQAIWQWFKLLNKNHEQAFIYVQTNLQPLMANRETASLMLDLLVMAYRDLMSICFEQERMLAFSKYEGELVNLANDTVRMNLAEIMSIILEGQKKLNSYVAAQGVFEQIAIKLQQFF